MASRRNLKKGIYKLTSSMISECYMLMLLFPDIKEEKVDNLIDEILDNCTQFVSRTNAYNGKNNPKVIKSYYASLRKELSEKTTDLYTKIATLSNEK